MKQIFRFFRGELNGYFLNALCTFLNFYIETIGMLDELVYRVKMQWVLDGFQTADELPIREEDLFNIGIIGGLFQPRSFALSSIGSVWFAPSSKVRHPNDPERSERGLVRMDYEDFAFVRVEAIPAHEDPPVGTATTDINTEASPDGAERRTTLREQGAELIGYVRDGLPLFTKEGEIIVANIIPATEPPPSDCAYIEWYGLKYLFLEEKFEGETPLTPEIYKLLFEAVQRVRRNGASITALLDITEAMSKDLDTGDLYIYDLEIKQAEITVAGEAQKKWWYEVRYSLNDAAVVHERERRYAAWENICKMKFKECVFINRAYDNP